MRALRSSVLSLAMASTAFADGLKCEMTWIGRFRSSLSRWYEVLRKTRPVATTLARPPVDLY
jgi:hypothetical protein